MPLVFLPPLTIGILVGAALATDRRGLSMLPKSPLRGVLLVRWLRFTRTMAIHPRAYESPRGHLGAWGMEARRLADAGLVASPRKATVGSETGVWTGDWRAPLTKEKFLRSVPLQYAAFTRGAVGLAPAATPLVGSVVDGKKCTLSGLLGVGHLAGAGGIESWVRDPVVRSRHPKTTQMFNLANGIF